MHAARTNDTWIDDLRTPDKAEEAIADLRRLLLRGLARSLQARTYVDAAFLEDVVQQAVLRILDNLASFQGRSRFTTWAMTIAMRTAMSELRRQHWQDVSLESLTEQGELTPALVVDDTSGIYQQAAQQALFDCLRRLIDTELTAKQRTALLADLHGMPLEEIARQTGSNVNAVYKLLHDARKRLKHGLEAAGYSAEDVQAAFIT
jgi:RNA polymerase sigma-70 factor (ECF subfamily)